MLFQSLQRIIQGIICRVGIYNLVRQQFEYYLEFLINMELELPHQWEEDQEYQYKPYPEMQLALQKDIEYDTDLLIIAEHGPSSIFAHSLIGPQQPINHLNFSKAKQCSLADLYEQNNRQTLLLIFNDTPQAMKDVLFSKFMQKYFKPKRIILLSSVSKNTLKDKTLPPLTFISTSVAQTVHLPRFDQGITGISADVLAWGEINRVSVIAFIASFGEYELTCNIVQQIFGALRGRYGFEGSFDISQQVKKYNMKNYSNKMYI